MSMYIPYNAVVVFVNMEECYVLMHVYFHGRNRDCGK